MLFDIERDGESVDALAVTTKSGYLFILNRETGEPVFGVEERAMPASQVPGEQAHPTQPIPNTPALGRVGYGPEDLVTADDTTAEHAEACAELVESAGPLHNEGPYTPWLHKEAGESGATLLFPGLAGGPNWGGVAFDPANRRLLAFIASTDDRRFRALDAASGDELWSTELPHHGNANPLTYLGPDGRQYVAIAATEEVVAFRLP